MKMDLKHMVDYLNLYFKNNQIYNDLHSNMFKPQMLYDVNLRILFPGYKSTPFHVDYLVQLNGCNISHDEIMEELYNYCCSNQNNINTIMELISDISHNWEEIDLNVYKIVEFEKYSLEEFLETICYISAQEEINYPRNKGYEGYKRPFYSYLEAIYAAMNEPVISIEDAISRCKLKARFYPKPEIDYTII